jgi:hypothetical protein
MRFKYEVLYGTAVLDDLVREKLITEDHHNHMWEIFNEKCDPINYVLVDLADVLVNLEQVDCEVIVNYMTANHKLKEFYTTKLAI